MKKKTLRKLAVALPLSVAAVIGVACAVQDYQGGAVFQPFASNRALQSNQVLFPDDGERTEQGMGDETDDSALWEKDREAEEASRPQQQDRADYLFQDNTPDTPSGTLAGTTTTQGTTSPGKIPGSILDIVGGDGSNADLIIGGGSSPAGRSPAATPGPGEAPPGAGGGGRAGGRGGGGGGGGGACPPAGALRGRRRLPVPRARRQPPPPSRTRRTTAGAAKARLPRQSPTIQRQPKTRRHPRGNRVTPAGVMQRISKSILLLQDQGTKQMRIQASL